MPIHSCSRCLKGFSATFSMIRFERWIYKSFAFLSCSSSLDYGNLVLNPLIIRKTKRFCLMARMPRQSIQPSALAALQINRPTDKGGCKTGKTIDNQPKSTSAKPTYIETMHTVALTIATYSLAIATNSLTTATYSLTIATCTLTIATYSLIIATNTLTIATCTLTTATYTLAMATGVAANDNCIATISSKYR